MSYLHSTDFLHRDLKPDNILLDEFLFPKFADFGLSKKSQSSNGFSIMKTIIGAIKGTQIYIAPEIWFKCEYSRLSDVFALAIIVYEIIACKRPFSWHRHLQSCNENTESKTSTIRQRST